MHVVAQNLTDRPLLTSDEGHTLGGGEWGVVDSTADPVKAAAERGELVLHRDLEVSDDTDPVVAELAARAEQLNGARSGDDDKADSPAKATHTRKASR